MAHRVVHRRCAMLACSQEDGAITLILHFMRPGLANMYGRAVGLYMLLVLHHTLYQALKRCTDQADLCMLWSHIETYIKRKFFARIKLIRNP